MGAVLKTRSKVGGPPPQKNLGPKNVLFWRDFRQLRTSIANISRTEQDIDKWETMLQATISPASADVIC